MEELPLDVIEKDCEKDSLLICWKALKGKKVSDRQWKAAEFVLSRRVWREPPPVKEFHLHVTDRMIEEAKVKAGLLPEHPQYQKIESQKPEAEITDVA